MKYTENMTFEEASKALIDELNANLATLHQHRPCNYTMTHKE